METWKMWECQGSGDAWGVLGFPTRVLELFWGFLKLPWGYEGFRGGSWSCPWDFGASQEGPGDALESPGAVLGLPRRFWGFPGVS